MASFPNFGECAAWLRRPSPGDPRGAFGLVQLCANTPYYPDGRVAVKILRTWGSHRFLWEVQMLSIAQGHPAINKLMDIVRCPWEPAGTEPELALVLEACSESLQTSWRSGRRSGPTELRRGFQDMFSALDHLHSRELL